MSFKCHVIKRSAWGEIQVLYPPVQIPVAEFSCYTARFDVTGPGANSPVLAMSGHGALLSQPAIIDFFCLESPSTYVSLRMLSVQHSLNP